MKTTSILMALFALFIVGCADKTTDEQSQEQVAGGLEPLAYTVYSENTELFVEFMPLVVGSRSNFAAHFTILGEQFLPLNSGKVTVSLIVDGNGIRNSADSASSPGIFRLGLIPNTPGSGRLIFDIETENYTDQIIINDISVFADVNSALDNQIIESVPDEIVYLKEQAWKVEFANVPVLETTFFNIIRTSGQLLSAPGDEMVVTASAGGIVRFTGNRSIIGSEVSQNTALFTITGGNLAENNLDIRYNEAKANFDKTKADYDRASVLVSDRIISQADFLQAKNAFENAQSVFNAISSNYSVSGQTIRSPMTGFVKNIMVNEGQYVETGTPLAVVSRNKKLILQANVSQRYFSQLNNIKSANFVPIGSEQVFDTQSLNGKVISYGKSTMANSTFLPITFEIDNLGNLISGSAAEVFLKSSPIPNALIIPISALMEEQGNFYVYLQLGGESFQKREIEIGASDGTNVQVLSGINEGDRVVTRGAYQIKLSSASGELPAHGHEH
ncbi:MAG TPA: efflux RND transporter periplasmic adaptor subunit [Bacteroidetes bacterium]|nr:efflux RND transporter periplasmic adaptor subunit [Bacteroidota bacterium]